MPTRPFDALDGDDRRVAESLPVRSAAPPENVAKTAGLDLPTVLASLARLEMQGIATRHGSSWRRPPKPRP